ncbi:MAG TPA: hypothetical protein VNT04_09690 [Gaiellaceae bacterium]|nr:hypothetical protein [Gaiellaceae bacterium]
MSAAAIDETEWGFGWLSAERPRLRIASHALAAEGRVWIVDPTDSAGLDDRIRAVGEPAAVVQLLDRHDRACGAVARRLGVPHLRVPAGVPESPFDVVPVLMRKWWREIALWWPERRVLVCADALGSVPHYFALAGEPLGVHPLLRLRPPIRLAELDPKHVLCGHGEGVHVNATAAVRDAIAHSRRRLVRLPLELFAAWRGR